MDFLQFCRDHGVLIDHIPPAGQWVRTKTSDKPGHRNGAVKWMGDVGFVQNWATMVEPAIWRGETQTLARERIRKEYRDSLRQSENLARKAAQKAAAILSECELTQHAYLDSKGFPEHVVNVWNGTTAVIPMRRGSQLVGCQMIGLDGDKKFLFGQRSGGAEYVFGRHGKHIICEGYATALSAQSALRNLKIPYTIHVAFSAGNMKRIASGLPQGVVLADNDASGTGERIAKEIGWPYWMSDCVGEDFNDAHRRLGIFRVAMQLKEVLWRRQA